MYPEIKIRPASAGTPIIGFTENMIQISDNNEKDTECQDSIPVK